MISLVKPFATPARKFIQKSHKWRMLFAASKVYHRSAAVVNRVVSRGKSADLMYFLRGRARLIRVGKAGIDPMAKHGRVVMVLKT